MLSWQLFHVKWDILEAVKKRRRSWKEIERKDWEAGRDKRLFGHQLL
jgi:hypothetical protein